LAFFAARLPEPVTREDAEDGTVTYLAGDPGEVIVQLSQRAIAVSEFRVRLDASGVPVAIPRLLGRIRWPRLPDDRAIAAVEALISAARQLRRDSFRTCAVCERQTPPERLHRSGVCLECSEQGLGVLH
jgi:hypothetical protein